MKAIPKILCLFLAGLITLSGFPFYQYEDISRDNNIDLQDVILVVKQVAKSANTETGFKNNIGRALSTINAAAEFITIIKPIKEKGVSFCLSFNDFPCVVSCLPIIPKKYNLTFLERKICKFKTIKISPVIPPPKYS